MYLLIFECDAAMPNQSERGRTKTRKSPEMVTRHVNCGLGDLACQTGAGAPARAPHVIEEATASREGEGERGREREARH